MLNITRLTFPFLNFYNLKILITVVSEINLNSLYNILLLSSKSGIVLKVFLSPSFLFSLAVSFTEGSDEMKPAKLRPWLGSSGDALSFQWSVGF